MTMGCLAVLECTKWRSFFDNLRGSGDYKRKWLDTWINIGDKYKSSLNDVGNKICKLGIIIYFGRYIIFEG